VSQPDVLDSDSALIDKEILFGESFFAEQPVKEPLYFTQRQI
jgi:hypothetical protein